MGAFALADAQIFIFFVFYFNVKFMDKRFSLFASLLCLFFSLQNSVCPIFVMKQLKGCFIYKTYLVLVSMFAGLDTL